MTETAVEPLRRELGDGLLLRSARRDDSDELVEFNATMHSGDELSAEPLADWTRDLFELPHPHFRLERDVTVVEDTASGRIVSTLFLIPQLWSYAGVTMPIAQPELIATHPDYRRRGLIRAQFDVAHRSSDSAGHLWQFISGIPWYYRQFGYAYAVDRPPRPTMWLRSKPVPEVAEWSVRPATPADIGPLAQIEREASSGTSIDVIRGTEGFSMELGRRPGSLLGTRLLVIESSPLSGPPVGFVAHRRRLHDGVSVVLAFELRRGISWLGPTSAVLAHLDRWTREHPDGPGRGVHLALPDGHAALRSAASRLVARERGGYGLYVRVPDVVEFVRAIGQVLETRVEASPAAGWTGTLRIDLYPGGIELCFEEGRLATVERRPEISGDDSDEVDASMPRDDFLHLLFGNRPISELERATADCFVHTDAGALLLDVLFPPMAMSYWGFC